MTRTAVRPVSKWASAFTGRRLLVGLLLAIAAVYLLLVAATVLLRWVDPFTTGVQIQRRVESWFAKGKYQKRQAWVPLERISPHMPHAVIASEDGRFYQHHGIDWLAVEEVLEDAEEKGKIARGASTITQQLTKNLFFTTHRNPLRKLAEYTLAPVVDTVLGKRRVLELYLNVVEFGPGVFGIEAASQYHYGISASKLSREQAARLTACLPAPLRRKPARMNWFSNNIQERMKMMGW